MAMTLSCLSRTGMLIISLWGAPALGRDLYTNDAVLAGAWERGFIESRLRLHSALDAVDVEVADSTVYLAGVVSEPLFSALAEQLAASGMTAKEIINRIVVIPEAVAPSERNRLVDLTLNNQVRSRFLTQTAVHGRDINVRTTDRVVTLSGIVESEVERDVAYWLARNTKGVTRVINKLAVAQNARSL